MQSGMFDVDGAELYYEMRGSGPLLVLIAGAGGDSGQYVGLAEELSDAFTVISYDRRGNSRSTGRVDALMTVAAQADDTKALIDGLAGGKALVFGNSGGAIIALDLAARHPQVVRGIVAHEPPIVGVLPADDPWFTFFDRIGARYHEVGAEITIGEFVSTIRGEGSYEWPEDMLNRFVGNVEHLFRSEWEAWGTFLPDEAALSKVDFPLVLGAGSADRGLYYGRPSVEIAGRIRAPWVEFPGIHLEFVARPEVFGAALRAILTQMHTTLEGVPAAWNTETDQAA